MMSLRIQHQAELTVRALHQAVHIQAAAAAGAALTQAASSKQKTNSNGVLNRLCCFRMG